MNIPTGSSGTESPQTCCLEWAHLELFIVESHDLLHRHSLIPPEEEVGHHLCEYLQLVCHLPRFAERSQRNSLQLFIHIFVLDLFEAFFVTATTNTSSHFDAPKCFIQTTNTERKNVVELKHFSIVWIHTDIFELINITRCWIFDMHHLHVSTSQQSWRAHRWSRSKDVNIHRCFVVTHFNSKHLPRNYRWSILFVYYTKGDLPPFYILFHAFMQCSATRLFGLISNRGGPFVAQKLEWTFVHWNHFCLLEWKQLWLCSLNIPRSQQQKTKQNL